MNTLKGVFGDIKPKHKRNFIQENIKQLREIQNYVHNKEKEMNFTVARPKKYQDVSSRVFSRTSGSQSRSSEPDLKDERTEKSKSSSKTTKVNDNLATHVTQVSVSQRSRSPQRIETKKRSTTGKEELLMDDNIPAIDRSPVSDGRTSRSLGCQTVDPTNVNDMHDGVIRYPSSRKSPTPKKKLPLKRPTTREMGLQTENSQISAETIITNAAVGDIPVPNNRNESDLLKLLQHNSDVDEPTEVPHANYVKKRPSNSRPRTVRLLDNPSKPPSSYRKGVIPKYLQERKEEIQKEVEQKKRDEPDPSCPPGYVSLPDHKRTEILKMLKKNYADSLQELNMMPVRSDTLRMRNRKMELEEQLNKIEHGIRKFSRPKVYVKIGA